MCFIKRKRQKSSGKTVCVSFLMARKSSWRPTPRSDTLCSCMFCEDGKKVGLFKGRWACIYIYIWSHVPCSYPPQWYGSPGCTPFPSVCRLLAAFLRSSLVFARSLLHFWLPASYLLGACYLLDDLRSTHTPSKYLRATYSHIYMCYVSTSYRYIYIYIYTL